MLSITATFYVLLDKHSICSLTLYSRSSFTSIWDFSMDYGATFFLLHWYWTPLAMYFCGNGALVLPFSILWFCWKAAGLKSVIPHAFVCAKSEMCNVLSWESMCKWTEYLRCVCVCACCSVLDDVGSEHDRKKQHVQLFFLRSWVMYTLSYFYYYCKAFISDCLWINLLIYYVCSQEEQCCKNDGLWLY